MRDSAQYEEVLAYLRKSWQRTAPGTTTPFASFLELEVNAFRAGEVAHLPYVRNDAETVWITVAPDSARLRSAMTGLRAWIIPSFGWEDLTRPIVSPSNYAGALAVPLASISPAGYYRWHSTTEQVTKTIAAKLASWRQLQSLRPVATAARNRGLFELREQFYLALTTGDRSIAEEAVQAIDDRQLDTASNTSFMRTRIRARFGSHSEIVHDPNLDRMLALRLPRIIATSIVEAFYEVSIRPLLEIGQEADAVDVYRIDILPKLARLLSVAQTEDGEGASWFLHQLSAKAPATPTVPGFEDTEQSFINALRKGDWRTVQKLGLSLEAREGTPELVRQFIESSLVESLRYLANPELSKLLLPVADHVSQPADWRGFLSSVSTLHLQDAEAFLSSEQRPLLDTTDSELIDSILSEVEEIMTTPSGESSGRYDLIANQLLPILVEDMVGDLDYPRCGIAPAYLGLLSVWVGNRSGRAMPGESNVVLSLAAGILQCQGTAEADVTIQLKAWWERRPVKAALPYLLAALELLTDFSSEHSTAQGLWIEGATFIKEKGVELTRMELSLWRRIGLHLGFDQTTVAEYLPIPMSAADSEPQDDSFAGQTLRRVAIVSLHEKSAKAAAEIIKERSGAEVIIVSEHVAGPATQSAQTADVVLLVWAATKHSVYRAFDKVRDKLAYVQGTGPSSIVMALERWAISHASPHV
jgi:hypothetical protein